MATEAELFAAVLAYPDEDTPRLAFADFLDEQGDPAKSDRAEFIRLQIEVENQGDAPRTPAQQRRLDELESEYREPWGPTLPDEFESGAFRRGFVESVSCHPTAFLEYGPELFTLAPIRRVRFQGEPEELAPIAGSPLFARIRSLSVGGAKLNTAQLLYLLRSPHLRDLAALQSDRNNHDDDTAAALAGCESLSALCELDLSNNRAITAAGARSIADGPHFGSLRTLNLFACDLGDDGFAAIARGRVLRALTTLNVGLCGISPVGIDELAAGEVDRLCALDLSANPIGAGIGVLARCNRLRSLRNLRLVNCGLGPEGAEHLGRSSAFDQLRTLWVTANNFGPDGAKALFGAGRFAELWDLQLDEDAIGEVGAAAIANAAGDELCWLSLCNNGIGDAGATALAGSPRLRNLYHLNLYGNDIGDAGAVALAQSPCLTNLGWLHIRNNPIGAVGAQALAESPHRTRGLPIMLDGHRVRKKVQRELRKRFPGRLDFTN